MLILRLIQVLLLILFVAGFYKQVILPIMKGTKLFPYFNSKRTKITNEIAEIKEELDIKTLENELETLKKSTKSKGDDNGLVG